MSAGWMDFMRNMFKQKMAVYLDGEKFEHLDYLGKEAYQHKLKELEWVLSHCRERSYDNSYVYGERHAEMRAALRKMSPKKLFELYDDFDKGEDRDGLKVCQEALKFSEILSNYAFWADVGLDEKNEIKIPNEKKLRKQYEPRFKEVGKMVKKLSWEDYSSYISIFSDIHDSFPAKNRSYYLICLSIIEPKLLIHLHKQYGKEIVSDGIIDWGKQQKNNTAKRQGKRDLLLGIMHTALMAAGTGGGVHQKVSPWITFGMAGFTGLLAFHTLVEYRKRQKEIAKTEEDRKFFKDDPMIMDIRKAIKQGSVYN